MALLLTVSISQNAYSRKSFLKLRRFLQEETTLLGAFYIATFRKLHFIQHSRRLVVRKFGLLGYEGKQVSEKYS